MRAAAVDIGTNSVKLVVAETPMRVLEERVVVTRLGEHLERKGSIDPAAARRTLETLRSFSEVAARYGVTRSAAVGTRVLRAALDRAAFLRRCRQETGWRIRILSAREEARLAFLGACADLDEAEAIDIGGGSTEVIVGRRGRLKKSWSMNLGAVNVTERFLRGDPPGSRAIAAAERVVRKAVLMRLRPTRREGTLVGIGGTIATIAGMAARRRPTAEAIHGRALDRGTLARWHVRLARLKVADRLRVRGLAPGRADIILGGLIILEAYLDAAGRDRLRVSARGLRYGLLRDLVSRRRE